MNKLKLREQRPHVDQCHGPDRVSGPRDPKARSLAAVRVSIVWGYPAAPLTGVTRYGQYSPRVGVRWGQSCPLSLPLFFFPNSLCTRSRSTERSLRLSSAPGGPVIHGVKFNSLCGSKCPRPFPEVWMGPSKVEMAAAGEGVRDSSPTREGTAPPHPSFGMLCAGNEKLSVAMETAIPCSFCHSL